MDERKFWEIFQQKKDANDPQLQSRIGNIYFRGSCGIKMNQATAFEWYKLSAEQGYAPAQKNLAFCYERGYGIKADIAEAKFWYKKAADQNDMDAAYYLAEIFEEEENDSEAKRFYELAAELGHIDAYVKVGDCYRVGSLGFEKNLEKAKMYYEKELAAKSFRKSLTFAVTTRLSYVTREIEAEKEAKALAERIAARNQVFVSYSHEDANILTEAEKFLKALELDNHIPYWIDRHLKTGDEWYKEIRENMAKAKAAVLIVSVDFLTSDFVRNKELPDLLKAADNEGATILPLLAGQCNHKDSPIGKYQFVTLPGEPLLPLESLAKGQRNRIYTKMAEDIKALFKPRDAEKKPEA